MGEYGWAWIKLPDDISNSIISFGREINKEDIYDEEGHGLEKQPHKPHVTKQSKTR